MVNIIDIQDSSLNISNLLSQFVFKKWKYENDTESDYAHGILILDASGIKPDYYYEQDSSTLIFKQTSIPSSFIWKGFNELNEKIGHLENLVYQLIKIVDPSIN